MAHALGLERLDLYLQFDRPLLEDELSAVRALVVARGERRPVAYLVGEREFFSLPFRVDERVLVPRPETEHLVELALERLAGVDGPWVCDVGTGSGCIAVSLLHEREDLRAVATDLSADALAVAVANAQRHGVAERLELHCGDLLAPLRGGPAWGRLHAVLSNPPYIVRGDPTVEIDVREHEPESALYVAGADPLEPVRRLLVEAWEALAPGGLLAVEVGAGSASAARALFAAAGYGDVTVVRDLGGIDRVVAGTRP